MTIYFELNIEYRLNAFPIKLKDTTVPRIKCFIIDYGVVSICNLACGYCRKHKSRIDRTKLDISPALDGLSLITEHFDAVMFKTSGWGEITLVPDFQRIFQHAKVLGYSVLQLITNGIKMPGERTLEELGNLGSFSIQLSLDGADLAANSHRYGSNTTLYFCVLAGLHRVLRQNIAVEINSVLTSINTEKIEPLLELLADLSERYRVPIMWLPRPLQIKRVCNPAIQPPSKASLDGLEELLLGGYSRYASILPPSNYLEGLFFFLRKGKRPWTAYDTLVRLCIGARGMVMLPGLDKELGSLGDADLSAIFTERARHHSISGDLDFVPKLTQFEIHSLFLGGAISWQEMAKVPSCRSLVAHDRLTDLRLQVLNAQSFSHR